MEGITELNDTDFVRIHGFARLFYTMEIYNYYRKSKSVLLSIKVHTISILWIFNLFPVSCICVFEAITIKITALPLRDMPQIVMPPYDCLLVVSVATLRDYVS